MEEHAVRSRLIRQTLRRCRRAALLAERRLHRDPKRVRRSELMLAIAPDLRLRIPERTAIMLATGAMKFTSMMDPSDAGVVGSAWMIPADAGDVRQDVDPLVFLLHLIQQADKGRGLGEIADPVGRLGPLRPHLIDEGH